MFPLVRFPRHWLGAVSCSILLSNAAMAQTHAPHASDLHAPTNLTIDEGLAAYEQGNYEAAYHALLPLALADMSAAQYLVGIMVLEGRGGEANPHKGVEWLLSAATQDNVNAQQMLGQIYLNGSYGIDKNSAVAAQWLQPLAEAGDPAAQFDMALAYMIGGTLEPSPETAVGWLQMASQYGHSNAQHLLARCYLSGYGVEKNPSEAALWFSKSAQQGIAQSQNDLGSLYVKGLGVNKNLGMAMAWFSISEANGFATAKINKSRLVPSLSAEDKEAAIRFEAQLRQTIRLPEKSK